MSLAVRERGCNTNAKEVIDLLGTVTLVKVRVSPNQHQQCRGQRRRSRSNNGWCCSQVRGTQTTNWHSHHRLVAIQYYAPVAGLTLLGLLILAAGCLLLAQYFRFLYIHHTYIHTYIHTYMHTYLHAYVNIDQTEFFCSSSSPCETPMLFLCYSFSGSCWLKPSSLVKRR